MIEINNISKTNLNKKIFSTVAKKVLSGENRGTENISLVFLKKEEIKKINKKFRKKDKPTDVLAFELSEPFLTGKQGLLGEILICPEVVSENAEKYGNTLKAEMMKVFVHGILHLLGYDHEKSLQQAKEMEKKQEKYLSKIK